MNLIRFAAAFALRSFLLKEVFYGSMNNLARQECLLSDDLPPI